MFPEIRRSHVRSPSLCLFFSHGCLRAMARYLYNLRSNQGHLRQESQVQPQATLRQMTLHSTEHPIGQSLAVVFSMQGGVGLIPPALWPKNQNIKQKQYCSKFRKDFKIGPHQKRKKSHVKSLLAPRCHNRAFSACCYQMNDQKGLH